MLAHHGDRSDRSTCAAAWSARGEGGGGGSTRRARRETGLAARELLEQEGAHCGGGRNAEGGRGGHARARGGLEDAAGECAGRGDVEEVVGAAGGVGCRLEDGEHHSDAAGAVAPARAALARRVEHAVDADALALAGRFFQPLEEPVAAAADQPSKVANANVVGEPVPPRAPILRVEVLWEQEVWLRGLWPTRLRAAEASEGWAESSRVERPRRQVRVRVRILELVGVLELVGGHALRGFLRAPESRCRHTQSAGGSVV
eukprot:CAMPEP_0183341172 /NCGR_PEP_ID=MMETSP0164_2-20130417/7453_1 /TAXON_ID=221442 /ORGANISM="Coccolithus pelagicus ssp braarudi, Strain PLY182g" /LENGTH=258 /DNA_ID=CAMNT_0025511411 /DNA_START=307 /DNA_END=1080 /DNA_ORIENTATION=-